MHAFMVANLKLDKRVYWLVHDLLQFLNNTANRREAGDGE